MTISRRISATIMSAIFLLVTRISVAAEPLHQNTTGNCSPNLANISGNVVVNISCPGLSKDDLIALLVQNGGLFVQQVKESDLGAGSLVVFAASTIPGDPALSSLLAMSTATTITSLYSNLDSVIPSLTARTLLANLAVKLRALGRPVIIVVSGFWPESCVSVAKTGYCSGWQSDKYSDRLSLRAAQGVKAVLAENGIPPNCIYTEGEGKRGSITPLPSDYRALPVRNINRWVAINRRIEIRILVSREGCSI
ncbi:outer membrane protein a [Caballeronia terrestris]|uniref:Outer membrane protein a n=1 Tax=Caballeronia terrestris TaxID=1226301 RepID=A0A158KMD7_9BURK|nr:outer membrane protein a [Caballeronia terrestris]